MLRGSWGEDRQGKGVAFADREWLMRTPEQPVRRESRGGGDTAWLLAPFPSANLLPFTKFIGKGLFIK